MPPVTSAFLSFGSRVVLTITLLVTFTKLVLTTILLVLGFSKLVLPSITLVTFGTILVGLPMMTLVIPLMRPGLLVVTIIAVVAGNVWTNVETFSTDEVTGTAAGCWVVLTSVVNTTPVESTDMVVGCWTTV